MVVCRPMVSRYLFNFFENDYIEIMFDRRAFHFVAEVGNNISECVRRVSNSKTLLCLREQGVG